MEKKPKRWKFILITIIIFVLISFLLSSIISLFIDAEPFGNVALIPVKGVLRVDSESSFGVATASSTEIVKQIKKADEKSSIKAIVLDINSPGGSAVASQEIADALEKTNKTTVSVIREVGASGGYWIASATDHIIASKMSITGSIGVISSYIEFAGLLQRYNMTYQRLVAGKYKDLGSPLKKLSFDEKEIIQKKINVLHDIFIKTVAENRNLPEDKVRELATGEFYLGIEALEYGLIDETGNLDTAKEYIKKDLNITNVEFVEYKTKKTLIDALSGVLSPQSFIIGRGIGYELKQSTPQKLDILT